MLSSTPLKEKVKNQWNSVRHKWTLSRVGSKLLSFLPILSWLPNYDWNHSFFGDLSGGLTMAVFCVPQGIALAGITGVDPVFGLYTAIFPSFLYIFVGTSKHNALGGFAVLSLMTHAAIENVISSSGTALYANQTTTEPSVNLLDIGNASSFLNDTDLETDLMASDWKADVVTNPEKRIQIATTIVFLAGVCQLLMAVFRLQSLTSLFSEQVMSGFIVGGGIHVFFAQMGDLLGIHLPKRSGPGYLYYRIIDLWDMLDQTNYATLSISISSILFLIVGKEVLSPWFGTAFQFPVPFELVLAVVGTSATNYAELSTRHNITVVKNIPTRFPRPKLPRFDLIRFIGPNALAIAITAVAIHITVAKVVEKRYKYKINHGQELYALGFVGVISSMFPVFPVTSGFARSVVGAAVGGSTQLTCLFSSLALVSVILYIGKALEYLPKCILAAMIIVAQKGTYVKFAELRQLWPNFKMDFFIWVASFLLTVCYDMGPGLLMAIGFAVLTTVIRTQWPRWHFLSKDPEENVYKETKKSELEMVEDNVCIFRMDAPLIFTSVDHFTTAIWQCVKKWERSKIESFVTIDQMNTAQAEEVFENKMTAARRRWKRDAKKEERCSLVIDCSGFPYVDYLGLNTLKTVFTDLMAIGVQTYLVANKRDLLKLFEVTDFYTEVEKERLFLKVEDAVLVAQKEKKTQDRDTLTALASILTTETTLEESEEEEENELE